MHRIPPSDYAALLRHSTTWLPEELGVPRAIVQEARSLAGQVASAVGRREAVARHLLALAACRVGWMSSVARIPLFQAPGLLLADPRNEVFYWSLDPGMPWRFEEAATGRLAPLLSEQVPAARDRGARLLTTER
jgi:hypothetical protein